MKVSGQLHAFSRFTTGKERRFICNNDRSPSSLISVACNYDVMSNDSANPRVFFSSAVDRINRNFSRVSQLQSMGNSKRNSQQSHMLSPREQILSSEQYRISDFHNSRLVTITTQTSRFLFGTTYTEK
jgi:hypothetical protein